MKPAEPQTAAEIMEGVNQELFGRKEKRWRERHPFRASLPHTLTVEQRKARRERNAVRATSRAVHRSRRRHGRPLGR